MASYSHSKLNSFEKCPYQYKLKYIDKVKVDVPTTIELFLGDMVHRTLQELYKNLKFQKKISKANVLKNFKEDWEHYYLDDILIVKKGLTSENYKKMGEKFISDYFDTYNPFDDMTIISLETEDKITLPDGNKWHIKIDKLGYKGDTYFVCDYKTNSNMMLQEEADSDRQLAMYSIWVKDKFKDAKKVILKWHMLAFNKEITSERTEEELKKLQKEVTEKIKEIEKAKKFPTNITALCDYCIYRSICPSFKHQVELEKIESVKKFKENEGVQLVDEFSEIKMRLVELKEREEELKKKLVEYGKQFDIDAIYGSNKVAKLKEYEKIVMPEDKTQLINLMKKKGIYEEYVTVNYMKLNSSIIKNEVDEDIKKRVDIVKDTKITISKRKDL
jgi:hypothetical protein